MVAPTVAEQDRWFRNLADGEPFDAGQISLQTSLQLQISLANYFLAHPTPTGEGPVDPRTTDALTP